MMTVNQVCYSFAHLIGHEDIPTHQNGLVHHSTTTFSCERTLHTPYSTIWYGTKLPTIWYRDIKPSGGRLLHTYIHTYHRLTTHKHNVMDECSIDRHGLGSQVYRGRVRRRFLVHCATRPDPLSGHRGSKAGLYTSASLIGRNECL